MLISGNFSGLDQLKQDINQTVVQYQQEQDTWMAGIRNLLALWEDGVGEQNQLTNADLDAFTRANNEFLGSLGNAVGVSRESLGEGYNAAMRAVRNA